MVQLFLSDLREDTNQDASYLLKYCLYDSAESDENPHLKVKASTKIAEYRNQLKTKFLFYVCYLITITSNSTSSKPNKQMTQ